MVTELEELLDYSPNVAARIRGCPSEFALEIQKYTTLAGSKCNAILFSCIPMRSFDHHTIITKEDHNLEDLQIEISLREDNAEFEELLKDGSVGYIKFWDPIKTDDGVVDDPAKVEGFVTVSEKTFDCILSLLQKKKVPSHIALDVKGLKINFPAPSIWDVLKSPKLKIAEFTLIQPDQTFDQESSILDTTIKRIEESLTQIGTQLKKGVFIRLFK